MTNLLWQPSQERIERSNLGRFIKRVQQEVDAQVYDYPSLYDFSIKYPEKFWTAVWDYCGIRASGDRSRALIDADQMPGAAKSIAPRQNLRDRDIADALRKHFRRNGVYTQQFYEI